MTRNKASSEDTFLFAEMNPGYIEVKPNSPITLALLLEIKKRVAERKDEPEEGMLTILQGQKDSFGKDVYGRWEMHPIFKKLTKMALLDTEQKLVERLLTPYASGNESNSNSSSELDQREKEERDDARDRRGGAY